ncbi:MAG: DUF6056 family protein [Muribaculaceae bacterium]|nr:DUF6056 family protein [Muribaculaceae bacterium]
MFHTVYHVERRQLFVISIAATVFALWMFCARPSADSPGWHDDYAYSRIAEQVGNPYDYFSESSAHIVTFGDTCKSIVNHYMYVNGRLANLILYLLNYLPWWLIPILHGAAYWLMIAGIIKLGVGESYPKSGLAAICVVWWVWIVFPWYDMSVCTAYIVNYIWTSAMCLLSLWAMLDSPEQTRLRWLWLIIPTAMMHEGFSAIIGVGMLAYIIAQRKEYLARPRALILPAAFALLSTFTLLSPGFREIVSSRGNDMQAYIQDFGVLLFKNLPVYLIIAIYIFRCFRHFNRQRVVYLAMLLAGLAMMIFTKCTGRALWMTYLVCTIVTLQMCRHIKIGYSTANISTVILTLALGVWGYFLCKYQFRYTREKTAVEKEIRSNGFSRNYILSPVSFNEASPWWLFDVPEPSATNPKTNLRYIRLFEAAHTGTRLFEPITLPPAQNLPEALKRMPQLPSGLRGDVHGIISHERDTDKTILFTYQTRADHSLPGWHPLYSLQPIGAASEATFTIAIKCEERALIVAPRDTLWYYFAPHTPRALASHPLLNANLN